jgi:hypothetical protein
MESCFGINARSTRSFRQYPSICARAHSMANTKQHAVHTYLGNWLNCGVCTNCVAFISTSRSPLNRFTQCAILRLLVDSETVRTHHRCVSSEKNCHNPCEQISHQTDLLTVFLRWTRSSHFACRERGLRLHKREFDPTELIRMLRWTTHECLLLTRSHLGAGRQIQGIGSICCSCAELQSTV